MTVGELCGILENCDEDSDVRIIYPTNEILVCRSRHCPVARKVVDSKKNGQPYKKWV